MANPRSIGRLVVTQSPSKRLISVICPVLNEEASIGIFYERIQRVFASLCDRYEFELLFMNNCSTDRTLEILFSLCDRDPSVQVLTLSRNFGYQASVAAGLRYASGEAIAVIDVDCEDPPEMLAQFTQEWENGFDVVYGQRAERSEFIGMHLLRKAFYRLNRLIADSDIILDMAEFFLISASVREAILDNASTFPFLRSEVAYVGFKCKGIPYKRQPRAAGKSHYNLLRTVKFGVAGILSSSTMPLRLSAYLFLPLAMVNAFVLLGSGAQIVRGFQVLVVVDFLFVAFFLAVISIYLARTYKNVVRRPLYVVDWRHSRATRRPPG